MRFLAPFTGSAFHKKCFVLRGGLRLGLQPFVTDLGFCITPKGEIMELTLPVHVTPM
jgi:hypothetical protein